MSYTINRYFNENGEVAPSGTLFNDITVEDNISERTAISSPLMGTNYLDYAKDAAEAQVWRLSNYAFDLPPLNAIQGQLWFDTTSQALKVYVGDDYGTNPDDWRPLTEQSLTNINTDLIPSIDSAYDIGSSSRVWNVSQTGTLQTYVDIFSRGSLDTSQSRVSISSLIVTDPFEVPNAADVDGDSLGDAVARLNTKNGSFITDVIEVTQSGGTYDLAPVESGRYRFTSDIDITVNLDYINGNDVNYFEVVAAGLGKITLTTDAEITLDKNSFTGGNIFTCAYFVSTFKNHAGNQEGWHTVGNYT